MLRRYVFGPTLATLALLAARPVSADAIQFTGNVERDFAISPGNGVVPVVDNPNPAPGGPSDPKDVAQAPWMTQQGWTSGWNIKDLRLAYDDRSDTLFVGVNFFGIAGDADGNGNAGGADPRTSAAGGIDLPHLGGRESISVGLDLRNRSVPGVRSFDVVAGIPGDKTRAGPGINGFTVASYNNSNAGLAFSYGQTLTNHVGALAFDPDAEHPHFEFTVANFSKLNGFDPEEGFNIGVFAGTPDDVVAGEDQIPLTHITFPKDDSPQVPEPATLLSWTVLSGAAAWRLRSRRRPA
jgi:hypothetical protein